MLRFSKYGKPKSKHTPNSRIIILPYRMEIEQIAEKQFNKSGCYCRVQPSYIPHF